MTEPDYSNPYAAPAAEITVPVLTGGAALDKKTLIVPKDWHSPPICLFTGATEDLLPMRTRKLAWSNPVWILLFLLIGIFIVLFLVLLQKKGAIHYYISRTADAKRKKKLLINWGIFGLGALLLVLGAADRSSVQILFPAGLIVMILSAILGVTWCRLFAVRKIDKTHIWLANIRPEVREAIIRMEQENPMALEKPAQFWK